MVCLSSKLQCEGIHCGAEEKGVPSLRRTLGLALPRCHPWANLFTSPELHFPPMQNGATGRQHAA